MSLVGVEVRVEAPLPSRAYYDAIIIAINAARLVVKNSKTGALEHVDRATGKVMQFDRSRGWIPTGWTLHPADVELLRRTDEGARAQDVDGGTDLSLVQVEAPDRGE